MAASHALSTPFSLVFWSTNHFPYTLLAKLPAAFRRQFYAFHLRGVVALAAALQDIRSLYCLTVRTSLLRAIRNLRFDEMGQQ